MLMDYHYVSMSKCIKMEWLVLLGLTIFSLSLAEIDARIDGKLIKQKYGTIVSLNHTTRLLIRYGTTIFVFTFLFFIFKMNILLLLITMIYYCTLWWIYFEIRLNELRGLYWLYIGKTAWSDITVRKLFGDNANRILFMIKLIILMLSSIGIALVK